MSSEDFSHALPLPPRRIAVIVLFASTAVQSLVALCFIIFRAIRSKQLSKIKMLEIVISLSFIVHAITGIMTVYYVHNFIYDDRMVDN
jgi:heme/copper-type cytochrome/quinol oxidase subunit 4